MNDAANGVPTSGTARPAWQKWALIGGIAIAAYYLYTRYQANAAATAADPATTSGTAAPTSPLTAGGTLTDPNTGQSLSTFALDPTTGVPINPATDQDFGLTQLGSASNSLGAWITSAYNTATGLGASPGLTNQALYDYTNGNPLSSAEAGVISQLEGKIGLPPGNLLPFGGTVPSTPSTPVVTTPGGSTVSPTPGVTALSAVQKFVNTVYANMHNPATAKSVNPANAALAETDVKKGLATLPAGYSAPAGYTLNPATRILTPTPAKKAA